MKMFSIKKVAQNLLDAVIILQFPIIWCVSGLILNYITSTEFYTTLYNFCETDNKIAMCSGLIIIKHLSIIFYQGIIISLTIVFIILMVFVTVICAIKCLFGKYFYNCGNFNPGGVD